MEVRLSSCFKFSRNPNANVSALKSASSELVLIKSRYFLLIISHFLISCLAQFSLAPLLFLLRASFSLFIAKSKFSKAGLKVSTFRWIWTNCMACKWWKTSYKPEEIATFPTSKRYKRLMPSQIGMIWTTWDKHEGVWSEPASRIWRLSRGFSDSANFGLLLWDRIVEKRMSEADNSLAFWLKKNT